MSGQLPVELGNAAARLACVARVAHMRKSWKPSADSVSLPGKTWAAIDLRTRSVIVMLSSEQVGDPRTIARQPWASYNDADQCRMAATARQLLRDLRDAASLF